MRAIKAFPAKRLARLTVPTAAALKDACGSFEGVNNHLEDEKGRLERILASFQDGSIRALGNRDIRYVTAGIGSHSAVGETQVRKLLEEIERRKSYRLVRAIFKSLLASYRTVAVRHQLRVFLIRHFGSLPYNVQQFAKESGILEGDERLTAFSRQLSQSKDILNFCVSKGISSQILASEYGTELKLASIRAALADPVPDTIKELFSWTFADINGTPISDYYEAILAPFGKVVPPAEVQKVLMSTLVKKFRDPRIEEWPRLEGKSSEDRREACLGTIKRWLSIEYLDLFIKIIEATAVDRQFNPRKRFWLRYFERGVISDLTLVLASDANAVARRTRGQSAESEYMKWASLNALPDQSVLLMRLGDLVIAEWSHNGAMRFWKADSRSAPQFHLKDYSGADLRSGSIKIKVGSGYRDSIVHTPNGQWMTWASNAIEFHTGVRV
ncbi:EH signature domain-containing protein [Bradyrhizobium sp. F1.13.3]|uniref:EH signature domain-containing protein n=1 Tax=Bradyrhizobium sp. F1.13.3 TaxID=3156351 RepID=UPI003396E6CF